MATILQLYCPRTRTITILAAVRLYWDLRPPKLNLTWPPRARRRPADRPGRASCQIGARACAGQLDRSQRSRISDHVVVAGARRVHDGARACAGRLAQVQFVVVFSSISFKKYCPPPLNCAIMLPPLCSPPKHAIMPVMLPPPHYAKIYASAQYTVLFFIEICR